MPEQRTALVLAIRTAGLSVAEAARRLGVSRKTAHKWLARYDADPAGPLVDRSRRPARSPARTSDELEASVIEARDRHGWGPRKLHALLKAEGRDAPPPRTIAAIMRRHGRAATRKPPGPAATPPQRFERDTPNELRQLDFKGPLEIERRRVLPLSVLDDHSRYLLALRACTDQTFAAVQAVLWDVFGDVGLPESLLSDNYFSARNTLAGLSGFDAWLIRLGIRPIHGRAFHPQTQGKVERFHGTLERELWPRARRDSLEHFAEDLERWRPVYNSVRPHEAAGDEPPACRWRPSTKPRPASVPEVAYPADAVLRKVGPGGEVRWRSSRIQVGLGLAGEWARVIDRGDQVEVYYAAHRVRCVPAEILREPRRL